jgi:hypothetical protein
MNTPNKRAFIGKARKDGKYPVQLVYPLSGNRLHKLMTEAQLAELATDGYTVIGFPKEVNA